MRTAIHDNGQGRRPRLIAVLRAIVGEHRVGEMTFQELRTPTFPVAQEHVDLRQPVIAGMACRRLDAAGGEPARPSSLITAASRRENSW